MLEDLFKLSIMWSCAEGVAPDVAGGSMTELHETVIEELDRSLLQPFMSYRRPSGAIHNPASIHNPQNSSSVRDTTHPGVKCCLSNFN